MVMRGELLSSTALWETPRLSAVEKDEARKAVPNDPRADLVGLRISSDP